MANDSRTLEILLKLKDEASSKLNSIGNTMESAFKVGAVAVLGGVTAITAFGIASVKAFADAQVQMARFDATIATVPNTTAKMRDALLDASNASRKLGFDDEATANVLAKFYQRTKDVKTAIDLGNVAMDLARAKNIDLASAGTLVNQVLSGNGKVLKQYGIDIKEASTPLEALGELHDQVKGQAEGFANTITGKMTILGQIFGDLKEKIGGALAGLGIGSPLDFAIQLLIKLEAIDFAGVFTKWRNSLVAFVKNFLQFNEIVKGAKELWTVLVTFFNTYLKPSWDGLLKTIVDNKDTLLLLLGYFAKFLGVITAGAFIAGMTALVVMFEGIGKAIQAVKWFIDSLANAIRDFIKLIDSAIAKWNALKASVGNFGVGSAIGNLGASVIGGVKNILGIHDGVISPSGQLVSTAPDDWLIATKNPAGLGGGAGGITINLNGTFMSPRESMKSITDEIANELKRRLRL